MTANYQEYYKEQLVIVSGGAGSLGQAVVEAYIAQGARVVIADRLAPPTTNSNAEFREIDVLDEASVAAFFAGFGDRVGVLVNVVGGFKAGEPVANLALADLQNQFDLNLKSAFLLTKYAVQSMQQNGGGKIVHISSRAAVDKGAHSFAYSMTKQGVVRLVEATAAETLGHNININAIMPSIIDTPANRSAMPKADFNKWPKPAQIANVLLFLTSPDAELISGAAIPVHGKA
jgi:NAD(P)-dependent dehydrogenase (short-subunit alcohol dehydrogenase family)